MGKQARLKALRREARVMETRYGGGRNQEPLRILRGLHKTIMGHCHESPRRCWEYLLEMMAHSSGWRTDTEEAKHLWEPMADETRWLEFAQCWLNEVEWAKANNAPFSEPLGDLLEELEATNSNLGQFLTPVELVHVINTLTMGEPDRPLPSGRMSRRALDPCVGTGRFMINALVHNEGVAMHGVDLDLWMLRCAMLNVRLLAKWTSLRLENGEKFLLPVKTTEVDTKDAQWLGLYSKAEAKLREGGGLIVLGGRSIFMHGDAMEVDLDYTSNWLVAGWHWKPVPWRDNLKIAGWYGNYNQWIEAGQPPRFAEPTAQDVQFDYQMPDKTARAQHAIR